MENPSVSALCCREPRSGRAGQRRRAVGAGDRAIGSLFWLVGSKLFHGPTAPFSQAQILSERGACKASNMAWPHPIVSQAQSTGTESGNVVSGPSPSRIFSEPWFSHLQSEGNEIDSAAFTGE